MALAAGGATPATVSAQQRTLVSANILVSRDGPTPKTEFAIAAHPRLPGTLVATAIVTELDDTCRLYRSTDGGWTWQSTDFAELREHACGDPQVAFGASGTAYFAALTFRPDAVGRKRSVIAVYRSEDAGVSWLGPVIAGFGVQPDHPQLTVFSKHGHPDQVYVSLLHAVGSARRVGLYQSDDGGRTFSTLRRVADGGTRGVFNLNLATLSDGTLLAPYVQSGENIQPAQRKDPVNQFMLTASSDGGRTFSAPLVIGRQRLAPTNPIAATPAPSLIAVDTESSWFHDRAYAVWSDFSSERSRLLLSFSSDRGQTWSVPKPVDSRAPAVSDQFRAALAVAPDGTVGVAWFDNRAGDGVYAEYFAASVDGGETFLPSVRVSSAVSPRKAAGNVVFHPTIDSPSMTPQGEHSFALSNVGSRFADGGDYVGLTVDRAGVFHPFWPDSRTGSYQVWTARVAVDPEQASSATPPDDFLNRALRPVFDRATFDSASQAVDVEVRIRNISTSAICGPLFAYIVAPAAAGPTTDETKLSAVLNAANGRRRDGALFDYSRSFGDYRCLSGGEISNPIVWKIRPASSEPGFFQMQIRFSGQRVE